MNEGYVILVLALAGCGGGDEDGKQQSLKGGLDVGVQSNTLWATRHFCFTWKIYQLNEGLVPVWEMIDGETSPLCAANGIDTLNDLGVCYDGRRFLVEYTAYLYEDSTLMATLQATSGGSEADVCMKDTDTPTYAIIQWANPGDVGGLNPTLDVEQICFNDKLELEGDRLVSAMWLQPESRGEGTPDMFCALAIADECSTLTTVRAGLSSDVLIRYIFNAAGADEEFFLFYLAFDPDLAAGEMHLYNSPFVREHYSVPPDYGKATVPAVGACYYDGLLADSAGFLVFADTSLFVGYDQSAACNVAVDTDPVLEALDLAGVPLRRRVGERDHLGRGERAGVGREHRFDAGALTAAGRPHRPLRAEPGRRWRAVAADPDRWSEPRARHVRLRHPRRPQGRRSSCVPDEHPARRAQARGVRVRVTLRRQTPSPR